jgi:hypothetical protein
VAQGQEQRAIQHAERVDLPLRWAGHLADLAHTVAPQDGNASSSTSCPTPHNRARTPARHVQYNLAIGPIPPPSCRGRAVSTPPTISGVSRWCQKSPLR